MQSVDILVRIDGADHVGFRDVIRQRELNQDSVHGRIRVERRNEVDQGALVGVFRQAVLEGIHACLGRLPGFVSDIDLACRVLADQHHGETRG